jgi:uncharacterized protein
MIVKCPKCGKEASMTGNPYRPFCSERCKLLDLGNWISGNYKIPEENGTIANNTMEDGEETKHWKDTEAE